MKSLTQSVAVPAPPAPSRAPMKVAPRPTPVTSAPSPDADLLLKLAFAFFALDLFLTMSRFLEILTLAGGVRVPYLGVTLHVVTFVLALISGGARRVMASRMGVYLGFFTAWMMICTLLSTWRGGSTDTLVREWLPSFIIFVSCGTVVTLRQCRTVAAVLAGAAALIAVSSYSLGTVKEDRLSFEGGTLAGANDLAMLLILGAPFFLVPILSRNSSRIGKAAALVLGAIVLVVVVRSASRSGLLALVAILLVLFWSRPFAGKLKLGLLSIALIAAFLAVTPREILSRYSTLFTDADNGDEIATSAQESSMVRQHLLQQSLRLTMEHPIFGLGPGIFAVGEAKLAREEGEKATWHVSHNSYTQVSSETGIPGFLFYLAAIWTTFGNIFWFRSHGRGDATGRTSAIGMALLLSLISLCVTLLFSSSAYLPYMPMLMGLSVAFRSSLQWEMSLQSHSPALAVPQPTVAVAGPVPPVVTSSGKPIYRFLGRPRRSGA